MTERSVQKLPVAVLVGTLLLAGCGVKGALEPPPGTEAIAAPAPNTVVRSDAPGPSVTSTTTQTSSSSFANDQPPSEGKKKRLKQGKVPVTSQPIRPDTPFILDELL